MKSALPVKRVSCRSWRPAAAVPAVLSVVALSAGCAVGHEPPAGGHGSLTVMVWNIWHGGRHDGEDGLERVVEIIREADPDLALIVETYGSGERLADALGRTLVMHSPSNPRDNLSILSRFPVVETPTPWKAFHDLAVVVDVPGLGPLAVCNVWLSYAAEIWESGTRERYSVPELVSHVEQSSLPEITGILGTFEAWLEGAAIEHTLVGGDFNSMSHLDYTPDALDQHRAVIPWGVSQRMIEHGFEDAYRVVHPRPDRAADRTWSPRFPEQEQDRIDYLYVRSPSLRPVRAAVIDTHAVRFPSDHAALVFEFRWDLSGQNRGKYKPSK